MHVPMEALLKIKHRFRLSEIRLKSAVKIQRWLRRIIDPLRGLFLLCNIKVAVRKIQQKWRCYKLYHVMRNLQKLQHTAACLLQRNVRLKLLLSNDRKMFLLRRGLASKFDDMRADVVTSCQILIRYHWRKYKVAKAAREAEAAKIAAAQAAAAKKKKSKKTKKKGKGYRKLKTSPTQTFMTEDIEENDAPTLRS